MKNKSCKFAIVVAAAIVLLAGCGSDEQQDPVMQNETTGTKPTTSVATTVPSSKATTVPTTAIVTTRPTSGSVTQATAPVTTVPTTAPTAATTAALTAATTTAPTTKPTVAPTVVTTEPCNHLWGKAEGNAATCTEWGKKYTLCSKCETQGEDIDIPPLGHSWGEWYTVSEATCIANRKEAHECKRCGSNESRQIPGTKSLKLHSGGTFTHNTPASPWCFAYDNFVGCQHCGDDYIKETAPALEGEAASAWLHEAEAATLKYLNQYRAEIGSPEMTMLPGLSEVMRYRAKQYQENWYSAAHDPIETMEAFDLFKYGDYSEPNWTEEELEALKQAGFTPSFESHYVAVGGEAAHYSGGSMGETPDEYGYAVATGFRNSEGHWRYLKLAEWTYAGVGYRYEAGYGVAVYVYVTDRDYDAISAGR